MNAQVFRIFNSFGIAAALKIMPVGIDSENEVKIACFLSQQMHQTRCTRFPHVFTDAVCQETRLDTSSPFVQDLVDTAQKKKLLEIYEQHPNHLPQKLRVFRRSLHQRSFADVRELVANFVAEATIDDIIQIKSFPSRVLISELAYMDVNYLLRHQSNLLRTNTSIFAQIIIQTLSGIDEMLKLRILHKDIHFGNVLLKKMTNSVPNFFCLIHDFGTSDMECHHLQDYLFDIGKLIDCVFQTCTFVPQVHAANSILRDTEHLDVLSQSIKNIQLLFHKFVDMDNLTINWSMFDD